MRYCDSHCHPGLRGDDSMVGGDGSEEQHKKASIINKSEIMKYCLQILVMLSVLCAIDFAAASSSAPDQTQPSSNSNTKKPTTPPQAVAPTLTKSVSVTPFPTLFKVPDLHDSQQPPQAVPANPLPKNPPQAVFKVPGAGQAQQAPAPQNLTPTPPVVTTLPTITKTPEIPATPQMAEKPQVVAAPTTPVTTAANNDNDSGDSFIDTGKTALPRIKGDDDLLKASQNTTALPSQAAPAPSPAIVAAAPQKQPEPQAIATTQAPATATPVAPTATITQQPQAPATPVAAKSAPAPVITTATPAQKPQNPTLPAPLTQIVATPTPNAPAKTDAITQKPQVAVTQAVPNASTLNKAAMVSAAQKPQVSTAPSPTKDLDKPKAEDDTKKVAEKPVMPVINIPGSKSHDSDVAAVDPITKDVAKALPKKKTALELRREEKLGRKKHQEELRNEHKVVQNVPEPMTPDRLKFIEDEMVVLTLPNDDIVLGELTHDARISDMTGRDYIKVFWREYNKKATRESRQDLDLFVAAIDPHSPQSYEGGMQVDDARDAAFEAAHTSKISDLRVLIENYPILQATDDDGETLLQVAVDNDDIDLARFLLVHGIDLRASNSDGSDAISTAHDQDMIDLLNKAQ